LSAAQASFSLMKFSCFCFLFLFILRDKNGWNSNFLLKMIGTVVGMLEATEKFVNSKNRVLRLM